MKFYNLPPNTSKATIISQIGFGMSKICPLVLKGSFGLIKPVCDLKFKIFHHCSTIFEP